MRKEWMRRREKTDKEKRGERKRRRGYGKDSENGRET